MFDTFFKFYLLILEIGREENIRALFHPFMHSLVDSYMCPGQESKLQPLLIEMTLQPTELPGRGRPMLRIIPRNFFVRNSAFAILALPLQCLYFLIERHSPGLLGVFSLFVKSERGRHCKPLKVETERLRLLFLS